MTVNQIIEELYTSRDLDDCIKKIVKQDHQEDFKQELVLKIYDIPGQKLSELYYRKELKFYVVRTIINLVKNKNKVYQKTYMDPMINYDSSVVDSFGKADENHCIGERLEAEEREMKILFEIDAMDEKMNTPYYRLLIYLIKHLGSQRAVSRLTGIPVSSISEAVKRVRNHLATV